MYTILQSILPIFILIGIGMILQASMPKPPLSTRLMCRIGLGSCETMTSVLNRYALYLALPALIIHSLASTDAEQVNHTGVYFFTLVVLTVVLFIVYAATKQLKLKTDIANAYLFGVFFGNVAYIGFPFIARLIPGNDGVVSIIVAIHIAIAFTFGLALLEHSKNGSPASVAGKLVRNPLLISVVIGLLLLFTGIDMPSVLGAAVAMLAASASPVVLVAVGTFIASSWRLDETLWHSAYIAGLKILAVPLFFVTFAFFMPPSTALTVSLLEAAMPAALTTFALAEIYPIHKKIIANAIIISTVLSLFTLSLWSAILV